MSEKKRLFDDPPPTSGATAIGDDFGVFVPLGEPETKHDARFITLDEEDLIHVDINDPNEAHYTASLTYEQRSQKIKESIQIGGMLLVSLFILMWALIYLDFILIPLVLARFLVYLVQPFINYLVGKKTIPVLRRKLHLPRWIAVMIAFLLIFALLVCLGLIINASIQDVLHDKDKYLTRFNELLEQVITLGERWGYTREEVISMLPEIDFAAIAMDLVSGLLSFFPNMFLILLFFLYMVLEYDEKTLKSRLRAQVDKQIRTYIIIKVSLSAVSGFIAATVYLIFGVPFALLFALLTFLLNFIPNIGSIISYMLPIPVLILDDSIPWWAKITAIMIPLISDMLMGNFIEPKVLGNSMDIPAITVLVALMFWGQFWGIIGALLSVPLTVTIITYLKSFDHPLPRLLAGILEGDFSFMDDSTEVGVSSSVRTKKAKHEHEKPKKSKRKTAKTSETGDPFPVQV